MFTEKYFQANVKTWKQLQSEREALMNSHLEKTKDEAMTLWNRAKDDDKQRINKISDEQKRIEEESRAREEILRRGDEERIAVDKARKEELARQELLLSGRKMRSKTAELSAEEVRGGGGTFPCPSHRVSDREARQCPRLSAH